MITATNNQSPNFGALYKLQSYNNLGRQGENALNVTLPILKKKFGQDCDIYLGSFKNPETGQSQLAVWAASMRESFCPEGFFCSMFVKKSSSNAINPESLLVNTAEARISIVGDKSSLGDLAGEYEDIVVSPEFKMKNQSHNEAFNLSDDELDDMWLDSICEPREVLLEELDESDLKAFQRAKKL